MQILRKFEDFELRWAEPVGLPECPYLYRWVITINGYSLRLHHWLASDDQRHYHDHAWDFWVWIIGQGYIESILHPDGKRQTVFRERYDLTFYPAEHRHKVAIRPGTDSWSLVFSKRNRRKHGFWIEGRSKLLRPLRYFNRYGHHPCN